MRIRTELAWWRTTQAKVELDGQGDFTLAIEPRERGARYVVVPIGTVRPDEPLDRDKVIEAMRRLVAWEEGGEGVPDEDEDQDDEE
ncbi:MAG TPA: hypothetical protein VFD49_08915 [Candidatus Dormibacteraeota bacterium]|nr:hypothetical protein [Candidatus Dormibacteraeota bacterium]